jgi:uncharacterized protein YcfJ
MKRLAGFSAVAVLGILGSSASLADHKDHRGYYGQHDHGRHLGWGRHGGRDWDRGRSGYDYARVLHVEPLLRRVRYSEPRRECWYETRYDDRDYRYDNRYSGGGHRAAGEMIVGGLVGAAVGNQIGSGDGRRAATLAGAIIGSALGHDAAARRDSQGGQYYDQGRYYDDDYRRGERTFERCATHYHDRWDERVDGYRVTYEYLGRRHYARLPFHPGDRVRVRVDVFPAEY